MSKTVAISSLSELYIENSIKSPPKRYLKIHYEFSKGAVYKINMQKSAAALYTSN